MIFLGRSNGDLGFDLSHGLQVKYIFFKFGIPIVYDVNKRSGKFNIRIWP